MPRKDRKEEGNFKREGAGCSHVPKDEQVGKTGLAKQRQLWLELGEKKESL